MCGIAGAAFWDTASSPAEQEAIVGRMIDRLAHRGPDGRGLVRCTASGGTRGPQAVFAHTRLSIIDLSARANQPMTIASRPMWVTYNGEIYNFAEIRRTLEGAGRVFHSSSDTEVLLQGYDHWGPAVVDHLRGMFAFAIWDETRRELFFGRDRLGVKPLYFYRDDQCLLFASEIRALLASGVIERRLDPIALDQYLAYQSVPTPRTLVRGVRMLGPGRVAIARGADQFVEREYWDAIANATTDARSADRRDVVVRVHELLAESVRLHLVSDVPLGVFLSGGVDSAAVTSLMRQAGVTPRTFTIACPGTSFDEGPHARAVAQAFDTDHTEIVLDPNDMCRGLPRALDEVDHPSGDGLNTFLVSRAVRQTGIKVALSGLGGDEFFGGYPSFRRLGRLAPYGRLWGASPRGVRSAAAAAVRTLGRDSVSSTKAAALLETDGGLPQMFPVMRQMFSPTQREALLGRDFVRSAGDHRDPYVALLEDADARRGTLGTLSLVSFAEARTYMHDVLLRDTDQMSMRHGLEVRVPLLDHRLVEYLMGLPDDAREGGRGPKPLLVEGIGEPLPAACLQPKRGFVLPFGEWMRGPLRDYCDGRVVGSLATRGMMNAKALASLWQSFVAGERRTSWSRPWTLVALDAWLDETGVSL
jgi:asparagine synthase (glutamine-hydrolysing)